jgi:hypothetical protein
VDDSGLDVYAAGTPRWQRIRARHSELFRILIRSAASAGSGALSLQAIWLVATRPPEKKATLAQLSRPAVT